MERFTLAQAAEWTQGEAKGEAALTAVTTDSRQIPPDALFLPLKGERFDAHDFIGKAIENGVEDIPAKVIRADGGVEEILLHVKGLTEDEKQIILDGCLMNYYAKRA